MKSGYAFLAFFLLLPAVGAPLLAHPGYRRFSLPTRSVFAAAVGVVVLSWSMSVWSLLGIRWRIVPLLLEASLLSAGLRLFLRRRETDAPGGQAMPARGRVLPAYALAAAAVLLCAAASSVSAATSPDLLLFWGPKAERFASVRGIDAAYLADPFLDYMHSFYPPLVTNAFAFATILAGRFPWGAATLTFPLLLAGLAVALPGAMGRSFPPHEAAGTMTLVISVIAAIGTCAAIAGNGDMPLLFFEVLALALLLRRDRPATNDLLAGLLLAGVATAKPEGLPFLLTTGLAVAWIERASPRLRRTLAALVLPGLIALATWLLFGASKGIFFGYGDTAYSEGFHLPHLGSVLQALARALWSCDWALPFALPLLLALFRPGSPRMRLPIFVAAAMLGFLMLTYVHGKADPTEWVLWSSARVLLTPAALLALATAGAPLARDAIAGSA